MNTKTKIISGFGILLFITGSLVGLSLSGAVVWGEAEARLYASSSGTMGLQLECPLMISPAESGAIHAEIINLTEREIKPVVIAEVSRKGGARRESQTIILPPGAAMEAQWVVDSSDEIFSYLVLVNILQSQYRDNPSHWGSCGILLFSLFGLTGMQTFYLLFGGSVVNLLVGGGIWLYARKPLDNLAVNISQAGGWLAGMIVAALLCSLPRWWGFSLFLNAASLLLIGVILVEFILFPQKDK